MCARAYDASGILTRMQETESQSLTLNPLYNWANETQDIVQSLEDSEIGTGQRFYVDSGVTTAGDGTSVTKAKATIDEAVGLCTAGRGDIIYVVQGHAEAITAATSLVCDIAGVSIIGMGNGSLIPTLTFTTADTALVSVTAANVRISGIKFVANFANVASLITLAATADGAIIDNCVFTDTSTILNMLVCITVAADCDNITLAYNRFDAVVSATSDNAILLAGGSDNSRIVGNIVYGTFTDGGILASAAASTNITVTDNIVGTIDAIAVEMKSDTTGIFARNLCGANTTSIAAAVPVASLAAMYCFENYVTGALGASGIIIPGVDAD